MSALETLQKILPSKQAADHESKKGPEFKGLPALQQYIQLESKEKPSHSSLLLEHLRIQTSGSDSVLDLDSIDLESLDHLNQKFLEFNVTIKQYRKKLEPVETILVDFNKDLTQLSSSLVSLQQQSTKLSSDSNLQRTITEKLNPIILDLVISPEIVKSVLQDEVDVKWLDNLKFLSEKSQLVANIKSESKSFEKLEIGITLLTNKAVERIRDHIIKNIKALRSPGKCSSQTIQQNLLLVKEAFYFLQEQHKELANQLQLAYIHTMKWYYQTRFAKYIYALEKLHIRNIDSTYVLGSKAPNQISMADYLSSIDKRLSVLEDKSKSVTAIASQIAETTPFTYWLEFVFNQFSVALIDNIIVEYLFIVEFFYQGDEKFEKKDDWYHVMFNNVFKIGREFLTCYGTCDGYAILLMIRLIQSSQNILHNEFHIPILDDYLNSLLLILWPHFTKVIDVNCEAMKKSVIHTPKEAVLAPVNVTQQFAQFLSGLLKLSSLKGEPLYTSMSRLRNDFESFLTKYSNHAFGVTEKEIFLYNNYFLVVSILKNENTGGEANELIDEQIKHFELLCEAYSKH
ncbi:suppressor of actin mutation [Scheffersomyces stipitis CBS 6054]|uniref:Suppressor of actin mutation n=1 Tax=Scheffersomyces stipitis (strain ATCC 58785 / CBS 6054 / NBRC 10063 / NRRL Y-11545) TaxID=322104 RepID=A3GIE0_PICST|nr:suppressor of actin mutation [Scheffersomyces stipitis CBS 6054]EAZ63213.2 suppressor of actin mutation [Scheffersomyces stipitis CBS 6054]